MANVRCAPDDRDVPVDAGDTLLHGLKSAGIPIAHACGGRALCSTCRVMVVDGLDKCSDRSAGERKLAGKLKFADDIRLSCQTKVSGDVALRRLVVDAEDEELASQLASSPTESAAGRLARVAILFADVAGFTTFSESVPAYDVIHVLNRYFRRMGRVIDAEGGYIDNYMGDGLMALFGVDEPKAAALRSVRAGLAMLREAETLSRYMQDAYDTAFGIRVGIHYGPVVVGMLGACHKTRETAIGDAVNFASRIEAANKAAGTSLLVSEATHAQVAADVEVGRTVTVPIRGKAGEHTLYEILGLPDGGGD